MATYIEYINGYLDYAVTQSDRTNKLSISGVSDAPSIISDASKLYQTTCIVKNKFTTGDIIYLKNDFDPNTLKTTSGDIVDITQWFRLLKIESPYILGHGSEQTSVFPNTHGTTAAESNANTKALNAAFSEWVHTRGKVFKIVVGDLRTSSRTNIFVFDTYEVSDSLPANLAINKKQVKSINISNGVKDLTINGHKYSLSNNIFITEDKVKEHVATHTTWIAGDVIPTVEVIVDKNDYSTISSDGSHSITLDNWINSHPPKASENLIKSLLIDFKNDLTVSITNHLSFLMGLNGPSGNWWYQITMPSFSGTYTAGTWLFEEGKAARKVIVGGATIDTTAKISGLAVDYSKSTGISDGETITATVKYDASVADTLNGGTTDFVVSNIVVANPDVTVTEKEVTDYVDANIAWPSSGNSVTPQIFVKSTDYTSLKRATDFPTNVWYMEGYNDWPSSDTNVDGFAITFNNDLLTRNSSDHFYVINEASYGSSTVKLKILSNSFSEKTFKSGESWLFEDGKDPVPYVIPVASSANLDVTKWPALHPGTKLYTPDLHMVDGEERTFTVQADHGYTVNGGASVDYKYTVSLIKPTSWYVLAGNTIYKDGVAYDDAGGNTMNSIATDLSNDIYYSYATSIYKNKTKIQTAVNAPYSLAFDSNKVGYYGADNGDLFRISDNHFMYRPESGKHVIKLQISQTGDIYMLTASSNLYKNGVKVTWPSPVFAHDFVIDKDDNIYELNNSYIYKNGTILYPELGSSGQKVAITVDKDGNNYFAKNDGVWKNGIKLYSIPTSIFHSMKTDINGDLYHSFNPLSGEPLVVYKNGTKIFQSTSKLVSNENTLALTNEYGGNSGKW